MREIPRKRGLAALLAIAGFVAMGCGSSDSTSETSATLTKAQFIAKGSEICQKGLEEKDALVKAAVAQSNASEGGDPSPQKEEGIAESILLKLQKITAELDELPPPARDKGAIEGIIAKFEAGMGIAKANMRSVFRTNYFEKADSAARAYGLEACNF